MLRIVKIQVDFRIRSQKPLTQMSDITYMKEQKYMSSCSVIIYRLMLTKMFEGR